MGKDKGKYEKDKGKIDRKDHEKDKRKENRGENETKTWKMKEVKGEWKR